MQDEETKFTFRKRFEFTIAENIQKNLESIRQEEAEFKRSFNDWMNQYHTWKEANKRKYSA